MRINRKKPTLRAHLTTEQLWYFMIGGDSPFESEDAEREAWDRSRGKIIEDLGYLVRPDAWWKFDAPGPKLQGESDIEALERFGVLSVEEKRILAGQRRAACRVEDR